METIPELINKNKSEQIIIKVSEQLKKVIQDHVASNKKKSMSDYILKLVIGDLQKKKII